MKKTVLTILAHPDDCEINCAGTLILLANKGWDIHIATCSTGDCGSAVLQPNVIGSTRREEAQKAAQLIGGTYHCLGGTDLHIFDDDFMRGAATALIRKVNPDIVITHFPVDYMPDHTAASAITRCATFTAPIINYVQGDSAGYPATDKIVPIYYVRPMEGVDWLGVKQEPHFYLDISRCC